MDSQKNTEIISRIKYLMREMGVKQVQFAQRIGVDTSNLSKYLNGHMPLSDSFLNRLVVNLGISKEWLLEGTDLPFGKTPVNFDAGEGLLEITQLQWVHQYMMWMPQLVLLRVATICFPVKTSWDGLICPTSVPTAELCVSAVTRWLLLSRTAILSQCAS